MFCESFSNKEIRLELFPIISNGKPHSTYLHFFKLVIDRVGRKLSIAVPKHSSMAVTGQGDNMLSVLILRLNKC